MSAQRQAQYESLRPQVEQLNYKLNTLTDKINEKHKLQNNILNIMELYDIFQPIIKKKYIIEKIINNKYEMEICELRQEQGNIHLVLKNIRNQIHKGFNDE